METPLNNRLYTWDAVEPRNAIALCEYAISLLKRKYAFSRIEYPGYVQYVFKVGAIFEDDEVLIELSNNQEFWLKYWRASFNLDEGEIAHLIQIPITEEDAWTS